MRVLYLARAPFVSGAERALRSMLRHLDRDRVEPAAVLGRHTTLVDDLQERRVRVWVAPLPRRTWRSAVGWWWSLRRLRRIIREFKPDLLHANDVPSCQAMSVLGAALGIPSVLHVSWAITASDAGWWARCGVESVLCISQWMRTQLGQTAGTPLASARVEVLPDSVDWPAERPPSDPSESPGSAPAANAQHRPAIGFAGQLIEAKGLDLVIEALARLPVGERPLLRVAGEDTQKAGAYRRELQELAERRGVAESIEWLGFVSDIRRLYERVDAVVCPSRLEPLGLVPLEAAEFARPAIANAVGGLAESIVDGETGWLTAATVDDWARVLPRLRDAAAVKRLGRAARERTRRLYAPMVYQQRLLAVYQGLLDARRPAARP